MLTFLCLLAFRPAFATNPKIVPSTITDVTVFLQGAQVTREARVAVRKGENHFRFAGLATQVDPRSIQAVAPRVVLINSVSHEINFLQEQAQSPRITATQDSLETAKDELQRLNKANQVLQQEKDMLLQNQSIAGKETGVSIDELARAADFFRQRLTDIQERILRNQLSIQQLNQQSTRLKRQLKAWNQTQNQPSSDIVVQLNSDYDRTVTLRIRYLVQAAGWIPRYDIRAENTQSPVKITYNADVYQQTGIDWKNVKLTLSSGNPQQSGTKPDLQQWNLYAGNTTYKSRTRGGEVYAIEREEAEKKMKKSKFKDLEQDYFESTTLADYTTVRQGAVTAEFSIAIPQDIFSNGKKEQVTIQNSELPAIFQHYAVPKLDKDAFLVARVTDWEALNLLPGKVNIFFEGTYVTESYLDTENTSDTLDFSLGRDKKVIIQRNLLKDYNKRRAIGLNRERTFGYEIVIRNTKNSPIRLQLLDQLPVSQDERISVKQIELSNATHDENTGKLSWNLILQSAQTEKLKLIFSVKHPKKSNVPGI